MSKNFRRKRPGNTWNANFVNTGGDRPPPHLKGKQIGLYYRDRFKQNKELGRPAKKEKIISFGLPTRVENRVCHKLQTIEKLAKSLNIPIAPIQSSLFMTTKEPDVKLETTTSDTCSQNSDSKEDRELSGIDQFNVTWSPNVEEQSELDMSIESTDDSQTFKKPNVVDQSELEMSMKNTNESHIFKKPNSYPSFHNESPHPGPSTFLPEFVPIDKDDPNDYDGEKMLSLRGGGDYKYGYKDIITGTFEEKLEECLSKGISINSSTQEVQELSLNLYEELQATRNKSGYKKMLKFRETLPAYKKAGDLMNVISSNQVVVISGETGCGKSTQVPQLILDSAICKKQGANVHILVTQPRRIAASSLAARVSAERAERMGNSVGYAVRLEKVEARSRGSIMFCTTGILLADLEVNQGLTSYSHVILDEVHERDCHIDLSMCMLKKVLKKRKNMKLILMSATLDADKLSAYFDNCPMLHIEGLAYPVQDIYMEDILLMTDYQVPPEQPTRAPKSRRYIHTKGFKRKEGAKMEKEMKYHAEMDHCIKTLLQRRPELQAIRHNLFNPKIEDLDPNLIVALLIHICRGPAGAILVFLPGIGDISKLLRAMTDSGHFPNTRYEIYPLHSKLPSLEQHRIFERPPEGIRKIIIATNIAETSITIDDIVYVVDSGKIKISGLNVEENVATLQTEWVSQANLRQRRGRAGRCQPGICYHLIPTYRAELLPERLLPELQRSDLLEPVLTIKRLRLGNAGQAMASMPSPPAVSTVNWAVKHLQQCGALNDTETLTPLGWHLARLPVHPSAGKLLLLGSLFGCLDRAASVAAVLGFKDPFQLVIGKEQLVDEAKRKLALGEPSDHVAISEAIIQWENCPHYERNHFAYEHFLSTSTLELLSDMKRQFGDSLKQMGFLPNGDIKSGWENRNADNISVFKAIVAAALYPKVATVRWIHRNAQHKGKQPRAKAYLPSSGGVAIHPSSVMSVGYRPGSQSIQVCHSPGANWLVYWLKQRSTDLFLIDVTLVHTLPILFFGELSVKVEDDNDEKDMCKVSIFELKVRCNRRTMSILFQLRALLDQVLASKVMASGSRGTTHCDFQECVLKAVIELITAEDERTEHFGDDDDISESDSDHGSTSFK